MTRTSTILGMSIIPGGLLLAICCALPAVKGCGDNDPVIPYSVPELIEPYVWGAITALVFALLLWRPALVRALARVDLAAAALLFAASGLWYHIDVLGAEADDLDGQRIFLLASWWPLAALALFAFLPRREPAWRLGRATWATALLCASWFASFWREALYGLWVSIGACAALAVAGFLFERSAPRPRPRAG